ncbi:hypothetical protein OO015_00560 [Thermomicrobium sp. 4228-Ro]|uniref:hypothetical protein n=1 Tax=Thermomicrobium sp. 4228-Ro TaxID=2993937 RepID=UPI00224877CE|nr:hypothetical protein [Thermomicrobium sp. 4228-Ro]MCX2725999.1 hypothetical protein [Thermomicrobium sp. 4228-Ro]
MDEMTFPTVTGGQEPEESAQLPLEDAGLAGTGAPDTPEEQEAALGEQEAADPEAYRKRAEEWERRFKGLQARIQREVEARRALELERARLEAQLQQFILQQQLEQVPEEERPQVAQQMYADLMMQQKAAQLSYAEQQLQELAKHLVVMTLAQRYGVPAERLYQINDPYAMEMVARELSQIRRQAAKSQRKMTQADRFEGTAGGAGPRQPETFDEAVEAIVRSLQGR